MSSWNRRTGIEILVVEDSATQAMQLVGILEKHGYATRVAVNGQDAVEKLKESVPALIISDIMMPGMDGYTMCAMLKKDDALRKIPVILVTTLSDPNDVLRGLECGADNFIRKPVDEQYLLSRIDYLLMNLELRRHQKTQMGMEIDLRGQRHFINSDRQQILDLLISTYEQAVDLNRELSRRERELANSNDVLDSLYRIADELNHGLDAETVASCVLDRVMEFPDVRGASVVMGGGTLASRGDDDAPDTISLPLTLPKSNRTGEFRVTPYDEAGFNDDKYQMFRNIGNQLAVALERADLYANLEQIVADRTAEVADLNRLYSVLSGVNTSIVRNDSVDEMLTEVCRVATDEGQLPLAWVALTEGNPEDEPHIVCVGGAVERPSDAQLQKVFAGIRASGLVESAIEAGIPVIRHDVTGQRQILGVHVPEMSGRYASVATLPLYRDGNPAGVLLLYAERRDAFDHNKELALLTEIAGDISFALTYREKAKRIDYLAYYDSVTDLPNRALFTDRLEQAVGDAQRGGESVAVAVLNLDRFKTINDSLGHAVGDQFLQVVAKRLEAAFRGGSTIARLAGDEFAFVLDDVGEAGAGYAVDRLVECFQDPFIAGTHELFASASIGVSLYPTDATDGTELLRNAEAAMYRAKANGGNTYEFYAADMTSKARERLALENALRRALEKNEFLVHYQPVVDLTDGAITGVEALVRWQNTERGLVSPFHFIPIAEETTLIVELGEWVLEEACRQVTTGWPGAPAGLRVAVNVSTRQFLQGDFCNTVTSVLERTGLDPTRLALEITESHLMHNLDTMVAIMKRLAEMGVRFSIDDFGTGYSSLSYLKNLPIETLKVDRSFVMHLPGSANDASITDAIIVMAHSLNQRVIAEGVETVEQLDFLRAHGCDAVQGYYFSKPLPPDELAPLLEHGFPSESK